MGYQGCMLWLRHLSIFLYQRIVNICIRFCELYPRSIPNISHISHREWVRPFAKMMAKPKGQTKSVEREWAWSAFLLRTSARTLTNKIWGWGSANQDCRTKIAFDRLMVKSVKEHLKWEKVPRKGGTDAERDCWRQTLSFYHLPLLLVLLVTI